ncbi:glycoside hydrolase superfamily [Lophiotrema nucula]|uniref:Glycoside hydrolase superfamily n=1 Tax=Lophiotrema nucula TaxID=690887 RepID=A0A6A5Z4U0_9PLEO|nr:glycoside hydrolase superfamily [Lophiotrema nucula]
MQGLFKKAKADLEGLLDTDSHANPPPAYQQAYSHIPKAPSDINRPILPLRGMSQDEPDKISEPTATDILRYRYHHGTNLGSIFVIERWLHNSRFPDPADGSSELACVKSWVDKIGVEETRKKFEDAWANAVTDADIQWLANEAKATTIRLPIGYFDLDPDFAENTPFAPYKKVYVNAWPSICHLISRLNAHSIGTLIDLHALPGGANAGEHSGTNSGTAQFWAVEDNRSLGVRCAEFLAEQVQGLDGVAGIQLVNEADWESERLYEWYDECIDTISTIDNTIPVIISDGWNLNKAVEYSLKKNHAYPDKPTAPVIIDTHYYWAFSGEDKSKSPQQVVKDVDTKLRELDAKEGSVIDRGAVQVIVGEYSCVLSEDSWEKRGDAQKEDLVKQFGNAQTKRWQLRAGGAFFWTWKMDWYPGGEWGFAAQTSNKALIPPQNSTIPTSLIPSLVSKADHRRDERMYHAVNQHVAYWNHLTPNTPCEHWRYEYGWKVGYYDAQAFFTGKDGVNGGNKIGNLEIWVLKRIRDSGFKGNFVWEFEQGVRRGVEDFFGIVGIA